MLGVTTSLTGRRWVGPTDATTRAAEALFQHHQLPFHLCHILARQGVGSDQVDDYLAPSIKSLLPDPRTLRDCDVAAGRIVTAAQNRERVAIFADYDVDGASSGALLHDFLAHFQCPPTLYVPDRIDEGYGPNAPAMQQLASGHDLIICVDCGTLSHDALAAVQGSDTDVIVLDHHLGGETLPPALAVVNPNRQDESGDLAHLCAAAVVFLVLVEAARQLRAQNVAPPDLLGMLDLVGLATVADVAPLIGVNRAFVRQGLKIMGQRKRIGLNALCDVARIDSHPTAYHLGYVLGPRINAGGRIGAADLGLRLLTAQSPDQATNLAAQLDGLNTDRRGVEALVSQAALAQVDARSNMGGLAWAADDGWHPGIVGIVASRLKEKTNRPSVVIGFDGDNGKGSGRSVAGVDLGAAIQRLASEGLIEKGGGHKMAAGLSLHKSQLAPAMERLDHLLSAQGADALGPADLKVDAVLMADVISVDLIEALDTAGPFGASAPAPRFALPAMTLKYSKRVGENHLKVTLSDGMGHSIDGIIFSAFDSVMGQILSDSSGEKFHFAGRIEANTWGGRTRPQIKIEDVAYVTPDS